MHSLFLPVEHGRAGQVENVLLTGLFMHVGLTVRCLMNEQT